MARLTALAALILLAAGVWLHALTAPAVLTVTFLDVGQGDSIVIQTPAGHVLVVDAGRRTPEDDMGRRVVLPFLRAQGINHVDALVLTHPDEDHVGGAQTLLERVSIARLLVCGFPETTPTYDRVLQTARDHAVPIQPIARGQTLDFHDGATAHVLNPPPGGSHAEHHPDNNSSVVLRLHYGATSFLLTGDAEADAEEDILRSGALVQSDVLKLGHHGSRTSSSEPFLDAVRPQVAIVSAGRHNVFGHPHPDVLKRLDARSIRILRTDRDGAVTITSDGRALHIATMKAASAAP